MSRWIGPAVLAAVVLAGGTGCAGVPSGGQVVTGMPAERAERVDNPYVRLIPIGPDADWGPAEIVSGFLAASASFDDDHRVAKEYLGDKPRWSPGPRPFVTVLADRVLSPQVVQVEGGRATVRVTGDQLGTITSDGQYTAAPKDIDATFQLAKTRAGVWRITGLPGGDKAGLILTKDDVERAMRTVNLYFFAPDRRTLVPNGIFLPVANRQALPTQLVNALLSGSTSWLNGAVQTAFPEGTKLRGPVEVDNEVATVDLTDAARTGDVEHMSAQLSWTLRQLSEIQHWRLRIGGETVTPDGMDSTQSVWAWQANSPDGPDAKGQSRQNAYIVDKTGALGTLRGDRAHPVVTGPAGHLSHPAVSPDYGEIAGLGQNGDQLVLASPVTNAAVSRVLLTAREGAHFTAPSWGRDGTLWTVESTSEESWLWMRRPGGKPVRTAHWGLGGREVLGFEVARDGVRAAVIVRVDGRAQVQIGRIAHAPDGTLGIGAFLPVSSELQDAVDIAWRDYNNLVVLGRAQRDSQTLPYLMPVSGSAITSLGVGSLGEPQTITAAPGAPILIGTRSAGEQKICRQSSPTNPYSPWICPTTGSDPDYPR